MAGWMVARVHPRAGGEHTGTSARTTGMSGSSPRGRGARCHGDQQPDRDGLIPARAGSTTNQRCCWPLRPAHPRAGGEHCATRGSLPPTLGSSPRGRGARTRRRRERGGRRLIPARAGSTHPWWARSPTSGAHPRAGGEHRLWLLIFWLLSGSSPRGRGAPASPTTPAARRPAHPRAGGEHNAAAVGNAVNVGSSPRGRGALQVFEDVDLLGGLIPARAGSTSGSTVRRCSRWAHPRAGGEHRIMRNTNPNVAGSSPRGRGAPKAQSKRGGSVRLIPARAGSTVALGLTVAANGAHPRAGGEHPQLPSRDDRRSGSSPRGRGAPLRPTRRHRDQGLIPARAGSTRR